MKNTIGKVLLAGLMGGIALGAAAYHVMQIYLAETDAQDPVKAEAEPNSAPADEPVQEEAAADEPVKAEDEPVSAAADDSAEEASSDVSE